MRAGNSRQIARLHAGSHDDRGPDAKPGPIRVLILAIAAKRYGLDSSFRGLLPALSRFGGQLECIILTRDEQYHSLVFGGNVKCISVENRALTGGLYRRWWEQVYLPKIIREQAVDVIYTGNNTCILRSPVPCVIEVNNLEPFVPLDARTGAVLRARYHLLRRITFKSLTRAHRIVAVSEYVKEVLLSTGVREERIDVIYPGVDDISVDETVGPKYAKGYAFAAAKFVRYANLTGLIQAYARMRELGFTGDLLLAGGHHDRAYEREVKSLVVRLGVVGHVRFLGYRDRTEVLLLMRHCSVFLFPSTLEACPLTLLEAMRQGAPIVASSSGPMPEICKGAALLVDPFDYIRFGEAAHRIAVSSEFNTDMRAHSAAVGKSYKWEDTVSRLIATLQRAVRDTTQSRAGALVGDS